jgi:iron complex transport system ATP-binding protein
MTLAAEFVTVRIGGRALLDDVSLAVAPGEIVAVAGENGAGKSTLLRVLAGDIKPRQGRAVMNGRPLDAWPLSERARLRAVLPQDTAVAFGFSALDVVLLGRYPHCDGAPGSRDEAISRDALARLDVAHLADRDVTTLSGGERARVHLARVLTQLDDDTPKQRYLLLDEPTASLDLAHQHLALGLARELAAKRGVGVLAVLHDLNLAAQYADRIFLLKQGRVVASGVPEAVLSEALVSFAFSVRALVIPHPANGRPLVVAAP